jgi:hypothetical protein
MAVFFAENKDNPGGLQKVVIDEEKLSNEEKKGLDKIMKETGSATTLEEQLGGSKPSDSKIEVQGGNAISNEVEKKPEKKESGFKTFVKGVGEAFQNIAEGAEKKLETVYDDREKRMMFLSGLNTLIDASSYTPITKAKSPIGTIAGGQKKGFLESEAVETKRKKQDIDLISAQAKLLKAQKGEPKRIRDLDEEAILDLYTKGDNSYIKKYASDKNKYDALDTRYLEAFKLISEGKDIPTGTLESLLFPIEKVLAGTEIGNKLNKYFTDGKLNTKLIDEDNVAFKEVLNSASKQAIVSQVKDLYPASDKDIQVLLQGLGDVATTPEALVKLIAAQKAASEAYKLEGAIAKKLAFEDKDINFAVNAREMSLQKVAEQYNDQVPDELLVELYGSDDRSSPFRVASAYFYSTLKPQITATSKTNFEIFKEVTEQEQKNIDQTLEDQQKKFLEGTKN